MTATQASGELAVEYVDVGRLSTYHRNPRRGNIERIRESLRVHGQYRTLCVNRGTLTGRPDEVLAGNHTLLGARDEGYATVAVTFVDVDDEHAAKIVAVDNRSADLGDYDDQVLVELLRELPDLAGTGYDPADLAALEKALAAEESAIEQYGDAPVGSLSDRFLIPPMSVLDARRGWWQQRKKQWLAMGLRPETGRENVTSGAGLGMIAQRTGGHGNTQGLSVFDPVLCELIYRWWAPPGAVVLDPFAGGSVRGVVAGRLGCAYHGVDLRPEQVDDNRAQGHLVPDDQPPPTWHVGDATELHTMDLPRADLVFSCPPYADLERYSDDPRDLSTMPYEQFRDMHAKAIRVACERLADDAFAVWVIGEARGKDGGFYGLVADTVDAFLAAGLQFATEAVLVTMVGHAAMRSARDFTGGRTLTRTHQNVLVFCKGDRRRAVARLGDVDLADALAEYEQRYESDTASSLEEDGAGGSS